MGKKINDNLFIGEETKVRTMMTVPDANSGKPVHQFRY